MPVVDGDGQPVGVISVDDVLELTLPEDWRRRAGAGARLATRANGPVRQPSNDRKCRGLQSIHTMMDDPSSIRRHRTTREVAAPRWAP